MNLEYFLAPRSVAIIGASSNRAKIGRQILDNLIQGGYRGRIFPINLQDKKIAGLPAYAELKLIPRPDFSTMLAVIAIPAKFVFAEIAKGAALGVKNFIVISAGFKESSPEGKKMEAEMTALAKKYNLNILGPNCLGFINSKLRLNATFAASDLKPGNIALLSQSGAIGAAALDWFKLKKLGLAYFFSLGNKAALSEKEIIASLANDKQVDLIAIYLEEILAGEELMTLISKLAKIKPVVVLKAGQSSAGSQLALSHTGSLAGSSAIAKAAIERAGGIWLENLSELFNFLSVFKKQRHVSSRQTPLSIITNAGGLAVLAVDEISRRGLEFGGSFDLLGDASADDYQRELHRLLAIKKIGQLLIILTPQTATEPVKTAQAVIVAAKKYPNKIIVAAFTGGQAVSSAKKLLAEANVPTFDYPEEAIRALAVLNNYYHQAPAIVPYKPRLPKKQTVQASADYLGSLGLLRRYHIPTVTTARYEASNLHRYSYPSVLKAVGPDFLHKTDKGAVIVGLQNAKQLKAAAQRLIKENKSAWKNPDNYLIVQEMLIGFKEIIVGFKRDASFGPIIMVGFGGIYAEVFKDIKLEMGDLDRTRALRLIKSLKSYPILAGARGQQAYNIHQLANVLVNIAKLAADYPEIRELDINPLFIFKDKVAAADVRLIL
mgnify:CR=1 FL=1